MGIVVEVISQLENYAITKEALEVILVIGNSENKKIDLKCPRFKGHPTGQTHQ